MESNPACRRRSVSHGQPDLFRQIRQAIRKADPYLREDEESFQAAAVLLASVHLGPKPGAIAKALGYPLSRVSKFGRNLRCSGVWERGCLCCDWDNKRTGVLAFWLDVAVALGRLKRAESSR
jgi:hypothetical protein